ncbi:hypothetical protein ES703_58704 [subsurface metagenome]
MRLVACEIGYRIEHRNEHRRIIRGKVVFEMQYKLGWFFSDSIEEVYAEI